MLFADPYSQFKQQCYRGTDVKFAGREEETFLQKEAWQRRSFSEYMSARIEGIAVANISGTVAYSGPLSPRQAASRLGGK